MVEGGELERCEDVSGGRGDLWDDFPGRTCRGGRDTGGGRCRGTSTMVVRRAFVVVFWFGRVGRDGMVRGGRREMGILVWTAGIGY